LDARHGAQCTPPSYVCKPDNSGWLVCNVDGTYLVSYPILVKSSTVHLHDLFIPPFPPPSHILIHSRGISLQSFNALRYLFSLANTHGSPFTRTAEFAPRGPLASLSTTCPTAFRANSPNLLRCPLSVV
jgi:hypothetical protein